MFVLALTLGVLAGTAQDGSKDFAPEVRGGAVAATVRIYRGDGGAVVGSGTIIKQTPGFAYILTAEHVAGGGSRLDVQTFKASPDAKPDRLYRGAEIVIRAPDVRDLAVLRVPLQ